MLRSQASTWLLLRRPEGANRWENLYGDDADCYGDADGYDLDGDYHEHHGDGFGS